MHDSSPVSTPAFSDTLATSRKFHRIARPRVLRTDVWLSRPIEEVFDFFADAFNLNALTRLGCIFESWTPAPIVMRAGAIIDYKIRLKVVPKTWRTKITAYEPPFCFVDQQRREPYSLWHHEHTFRTERGGKMVTDKVNYALPLNFTPIAGLIHGLMVRHDLDHIFTYRTEQIRALRGERGRQRTDQA